MASTSKVTCQPVDGICTQCGRPVMGIGTCPTGRVENLRSTRAPGLGDFTEQMLSTIGVTKERYMAVKQMFGLAPTCSCSGRQQWLNRVSDWWRGESR